MYVWLDLKKYQIKLATDFWCDNVIKLFTAVITLLLA